MSNNNLASTKCAECEHRNVCSFKKGLETFCENLISDLDGNGITNDNENFTVEIKCKHFVNSAVVNPFIPGLYPTTTPLPFGHSYKGVTAPNPCEECPTYRMMQNDEIYIGDVPCEYCEHKPYKLTCDSTNT